MNNPIIEEINLKLQQKNFQAVIDIAFHLERNLHYPRNAEAWTYLQDIKAFQALGIKWRRYPWEQN